MKIYSILLILIFASAGCSNIPKENRNTEPNATDPFATPSTNSNPVPKLEVWRFIVRPNSPVPIGTAAEYISTANYDENMDGIEMATLRYLHLEGADFMNVPESVVSISEASQKALFVTCMCHRLDRQAVIFVKQTPENLRKIEEIIRSFGEIKVDRVEITSKATEPNQRLQTMRFTVPMNAIAQRPHV